MKFFKRLFCKHNFSYLRKTSGDENNYALSVGGRNIYICMHCGKSEHRRK